MSALSEVVSFSAYVIAWLAVGLAALSFFDSDDVMYETYTNLEHSYDAFLFIVLWPVVLMAFWLGFMDPPDGAA